MPYLLQEVKAGLITEIKKYYSSQYHAKGERGSKTKESSEAQKRQNQKIAEDHLRWLMNTNFKGGDYLIRLDFSKWPPLDSIEMQNMTAKAIRQLKRLYHKEGLELKYIYVKEVGKRSSRHLHMICNRIDTEILRTWWPYGGIHIDPIDSSGQYGQIASYFIKYAGRTEDAEGKLIGKRYYASRNLKKPQITRRVIRANRFKNTPKVPKGYYLDKDSVRNGISDITGWEYFSYTLVKLERGPNDS